MAQQNPTTEVFNMTLSGKGPLIIPINLDFRLGITEVEVDLSGQVQQGFIDFISGFYIDAADSTEDITVICAGSRQRIIIRAGDQRYMPTLSPNMPKFVFSAAVSPNIQIQTYFHNIPLLPFNVNANGQLVSGDWLTDAELRATPVPVELAAPTITDYSLTLDGTSQNLFAAGDAARYLVIQNPTGNSAVTVNIAGGDALTSGFTLAAGGTYETCTGIANIVTVAGTLGDDLIVFGGA